MSSPLISVDELKRLLASDDDVVLLDARASARDYEAQHLVRARYANVDTDLSSAKAPGADPSHGGRHPLPPIDVFAERLGNWGIGPETFVVVYDDQSGANAAARAWWMLRSIGHERVAVLDGGWQAAVAADVPTENGLPAISVKPSHPVTDWMRPTADVEQVDARRMDRDWMILDVRATPRFRGETEPIDPIAGHIPGAVNLPFSENLEDGRFKDADALRTQYEQLLGGLPADRLIVHCGSGVTACHTLLALEAAGLQGAALYVGSWSEWCRNELPRGTGDSERERGL